MPTEAEIERSYRAYLDRQNRKRRKRCRKCQRKREPHFFYERLNSGDGLSYWCKDCQNRESRARNRRVAHQT